VVLFWRSRVPKSHLAAPRSVNTWRGVDLVTPSRVWRTLLKMEKLPRKGYKKLVNQEARETLRPG
jgi:hypothetical protein